MGVTEAAAAVSCLSAVGCCALGLHTGFIACLSGLGAFFGGTARYAKKELRPALSRASADAWHEMSAPVVPLVRNVRGGAQQPWKRAPVVLPGAQHPHAGSFAETGSRRIISTGRRWWRRPPPKPSRLPSPPSPPRVRSAPPSLLPSPARPPPSPLPSPGRPPPSPRLQAAVSLDRRLLGPELAPRQPTPPSLPAGPQAVVLEWPEELIAAHGMGELLRAYFVEESCSLGRWRNCLRPLCWALRTCEAGVCRYLNEAFGDEVVPLAIPITLPEGMYPGIQTWLPELRIMLVLNLAFQDRRWVRSVKLAVVDGTLDQLANVIKSQWFPPDLRDTDPRLEDFTEPIDVKFDVALRWTADSRFRVELNDLSARLALPK